MWPENKQNTAFIFMLHRFSSYKQNSDSKGKSSKLYAGRTRDTERFYISHRVPIWPLPLCFHSSYDSATSKRGGRHSDRPDNWKRNLQAVWRVSGPIRAGQKKESLSPIGPWSINNSQGIQASFSKQCGLRETRQNANFCRWLWGLCTSLISGVKASTCDPSEKRKTSHTLIRLHWRLKNDTQTSHPWLWL